jgi:5-methyltetrahydropteroyltriglutamate--homocysteine methyltransferase
MKRSTNRILTTHVGSLPRPDELLSMMLARDTGRPYDPQALASLVGREVADVVRKQAEVGLDIIDDGEYGKPNFIFYVNERLSGFEGGGPPFNFGWAGTREAESFPEYYKELAEQMRDTRVMSAATATVCTGPVRYIGQKQLQTDLDNLKAALKDVKYEEAFVPAISPGNVLFGKTNRYYKTLEEFRAAVADALREEYKAIVDAGFLVQVDDPHFLTNYIRNPRLTLDQCRQEAEKHVELLNYALRGIPEDRIRFHTCYSINIGPRVHDMELKDIADILVTIRAQSYSFEAGNPRHDHEWRVWENVKLPEGRLLIPGVITHSNVLVEHPQLVADRLLRFAKAVGRENLIAGVDCGFGTMATVKEIHPTIVWAKFKSLVEGARIASKQLWGQAATV